MTPLLIQSQPKRYPSPFAFTQSPFPMEFNVPTVHELDAASRRPTVAVDVGFGNSSTSGIVFSKAPNESPTPIDNSCTTGFGKCARAIVKFAEGESEFNLILEAPLSGTFDGSGNPCGRLPFEKQNGATRYWYLQAGANVGLGAAFLLRNLSRRLETSTVHLFEGFVSFKSDSSEHTTDAEALIRELGNSKNRTVADPTDWPEESEADRCTSFLDLLDLGAVGSESSCPPVIVADAQSFP